METEDKERETGNAPTEGKKNKCYKEHGEKLWKSEWKRKERKKKLDQSKEN